MLKHSCFSMGRDVSDTRKSRKATPKQTLLRRRYMTSVEKSNTSREAAVPADKSAGTTCYVGAAASVMLLAQ